MTPFPEVGIEPIIRHQPLRKIVVTVCARHGISVEEFLGDCRRQNIVTARKEAIMLAAATGASSVQIGKAFNRDHSTILYHIGQEGKRLMRIPAIKDDDEYRLDMVEMFKRAFGYDPRESKDLLNDISWKVEPQDP